MTRNISNDDLLAAERRRTATYKLLAECYHEPNERLLELLSETPTEDVDVALEQLDDAITDLDSLRVDHAKLFVGPFELLAPPYESTYVDEPGRVMTESTANVQEAYRREGLDIGLDEPADHVTAELEFAAVLTHTGCEALAAGDDETASTYLRRQYEFLSTHLGRWVGPFADDVRDHADAEFYRRLADETQRFVERDGTRLGARLEALEEEHDDVLEAMAATDGR